MPNTLGLTTSSDAAQAKLLAGIMDEDTKLFREEPTLFDFRESDEAEGADPATKELLEEIDKSLKGFERRPVQHMVGRRRAERGESLMTEASEARAVGDRSPWTWRFVCDAIRLDGGRSRSARRRALPARFAARLAIRQTTCPATTLRSGTSDDAAGNHRGRRAEPHWLSRPGTPAGSPSLGSSAPSLAARRKGQTRAPAASDRRAPAALHVPRTVSADWPRTGAGACRAGGAGEATVYESPDQWSHLADPQRANRTTDLWKKHFAAWAADAVAKHAQEAVAECFRPIAQGFVQERRQSLVAEQEAQKQWLAKRTAEITEIKAGDAQRGLFDDHAGGSPPAWRSVSDPEKRLAAFGADNSLPLAKRSEADGVLRIHAKRQKILDALLDLGQPQIVPLGVLMLIPEVNHGA